MSGTAAPSRCFSSQTQLQATPRPLAAANQPSAQRTAHLHVAHDAHHHHGRALDDGHRLGGLQAIERGRDTEGSAGLVRGGQAGAGAVQEAAE